MERPPDPGAVTRRGDRVGRRPESPSRLNPQFYPLEWHRQAIGKLRPTGIGTRTIARARRVSGFQPGLGGGKIKCFAARPTPTASGSPPPLEAWTLDLPKPLPKILIADDNIQNVELLEAYLSDV